MPFSSSSSSSDRSNTGFQEQGALNEGDGSVNQNAFNIRRGGVTMTDSGAVDSSFQWATDVMQGAFGLVSDSMEYSTQSGRHAMSATETAYRDANRGETETLTRQLSIAAAVVLVAAMGAAAWRASK